RLGIDADSLYASVLDRCDVVKPQVRQNEAINASDDQPRESVRFEPIYPRRHHSGTRPTRYCRTPYAFMMIRSLLGSLLSRQRFQRLPYSMLSQWRLLKARHIGFEGANRRHAHR